MRTLVVEPFVYFAILFTLYFLIFSRTVYDFLCFVANLNLASSKNIVRLLSAVSAFPSEQQHVSERNDLQFLPQHVFNRSDRRRIWRRREESFELVSLKSILKRTKHLSLKDL